MARKPKRTDLGSFPFGGPHPYAYLAAWRVHAGLKQTEVAAMLPDATHTMVSRWENGATDVTAADFIMLAKIYGAVEPASLMYPPDACARATELRELNGILDSLPSDKAKVWIESAKAMARLAGSTPIPD